MRLVHHIAMATLLVAGQDSCDRSEAGRSVLVVTINAATQLDPALQVTDWAATVSYLDAAGERQSAPLSILRPQAPVPLPFHDLAVTIERLEAGGVRSEHPLVLGCATGTVARTPSLIVTAPVAAFACDHPADGPPAALDLSVALVAPL